MMAHFWWYLVLSHYLKKQQQELDPFWAKLSGSVHAINILGNENLETL